MVLDAKKVARRAAVSTARLNDMNDRRVKQTGTTQAACELTQVY